jgi:nucleoside-diphosphate-sugar epimerase
MKAGNIKALIARAADFYGPNAGAKSVIGVLAFDKLLKRKTPQTFVNADLPHSYTFTTDAAKALYILSKHDDAFGQTWHMPTASPALTGRQFINLIARETNGTKKIQVVPKFMLKILSWFNSLMKELYEMLYQNEYAYVFDSSKFDTAFNFTPTSYEQGVKETIEWMKR